MYPTSESLPQAAGMFFEERRMLYSWQATERIADHNWIAMENAELQLRIVSDVLRESNIVPERERSTFQVIYTNYKNKTNTRFIRPTCVYWGMSPWHQDPQILIDGFDTERKVDRTFALSGFKDWQRR